MTGATGFIGGHLARALIARGDEVVALVRGGASGIEGARDVRWDPAEGPLPAGALDAAKVTVAGTVDGQNVQDTALGAAENLITANPDLTAIYATGEPALLGAIAAVESQGRQANVAVYGWDLTAQAIAGIDAGYVKAVIQQDPAGMGAAAVEALGTLADGGTVEPVISVPVTIVTQENVEPYRAAFQ